MQPMDSNANKQNTNKNSGMAAYSLIVIIETWQYNLNKDRGISTIFSQNFQYSAIVIELELNEAEWSGTNNHQSGTCHTFPQSQLG